MYRLAISLIVAWNCTAVGIAQTVSKLPPEATRKVERIITEEMARRQIPSISVAIARKGQLEYANGFGLADLENSVPAKANTIYRTASIAKPMTAVAIMQLAEHGQLDLDKPVTEYCPDLPKKRWPITCRQLLSHLGGVRHYAKPGESTGKRHFLTVRDSLSLFKKDPLLHEPGSKFKYTTYGYTILGCVIENVTKQPYSQFMRKRVFDKASMQLTTVDHVHAVIPNRARGYIRLTAKDHQRLPPVQKRQFRVGQVINAVLHDTSMKVPGGGLVSSATDLVRFGSALQDETLLPRDTVAAMWTKQKLTNGMTIPYGLGFQLKEINGRSTIGHSGGQAGTSTHLLLIPAHHLSIAVMGNLQSVKMEQITTKIATQLVPQSSQQLVWSKTIDAGTVENEIKRLNVQLSKHLANYDAFQKAQRGLLRPDVSTLALLFSIIDRHDAKNTRFRSEAREMSYRLAKLAGHSKVATQQVFRSAKHEQQLLSDLIRGQSPQELRDAKRKPTPKWAQVVQREAIMRRMEQGFQALRRAGTVKKKTGLAAVMKHEGQLMSALATVLQAPSMDDVDDQDYQRHAHELELATSELSTAAAGDPKVVRSVISRMYWRCAACHESFR